MATSGGTGGNTTTGQSARLFYQNPDVRERLVELCPQEFRETFREILFYSKCFSTPDLKKGKKLKDSILKLK